MPVGCLSENISQMTELVVAPSQSREYTTQIENISTVEAPELREKVH